MRRRFRSPISPTRRTELNSSIEVLAALPSKTRVNLDSPSSWSRNVQPVLTPNLSANSKRIRTKN